MKAVDMLVQAQVNVALCAFENSLFRAPRPFAPMARGCHSWPVTGTGLIGPVFFLHSSRDCTYDDGITLSYDFHVFALLQHAWAKVKFELEKVHLVLGSNVQ